MKRPSPSMAVALLALFVALSGTAAAAKLMITSSKQIKNGVVKKADIGKNAIDSDRVINGALSLDDLSADAKGTIQAAGTQALEAVRNAGPNAVPKQTAQVVATLSNIPPGAYAIFAKSVLTANNEASTFPPNAGGSLGGHCVLDVGGDTDESRTLLGSPGSNSPGGISMQITHTYADVGAAKVTCDVTGAAWNASNTTIIALRVGQSPRQSVNGR